MGIQYGTHIVHTVQPGDTLYRLAWRYESDSDIIARVNGIYPPFTDMFVIYPGQVLVIPSTASARQKTLYVVQPGDILNSISGRFSSYPELVAGINSTVQNPDVLFPNQQLKIPLFLYDVEMGDSLFSISEKTGVPLDAIITANRFRPAVSPDLIYEGIKLMIPVPSSLNIVVTEPLPGAVITDGNPISGFARAFEANVLYRLLDDNDVEIVEETFTTADFAGPEFGQFRDTLPFAASPTSSGGVLQVYTRSAKDGSIQDLTEVNILFE